MLSFFIICVIATMLLYSTITILPVKAENAPYATFWIEIVSCYSGADDPNSVTIRLHPEGCYTTNGEIVDYEWTFNSMVPKIIHKTTSDSFEYWFPRYGGNSGAMYGLEGKTITLKVTDSNGLTNTFTSDPLIMPVTPIASFWIELVECNISSATIRLHPEASHAQAHYTRLVSFTWTFHTSYPAAIKPIVTTNRTDVEITFPRTGINATSYNLEGKTITLTVVDGNGLSDSYSQVMMLLPPTNIIPEVPFGTIIALFSMISALLIFVARAKKVSIKH